MKIVFDPKKDAINQMKHGMSLANAAWLDWSTLIANQDARRDYGEIRMIGMGYIGRRLHVVVYLGHDDVRRVISLRKANKREEKHYAQA